MGNGLFKEDEIINNQNTMKQEIQNIEGGNKLLEQVNGKPEEERIISDKSKGKIEVECKITEREQYTEIGTNEEEMLTVVKVKAEEEVKILKVDKECQTSDLNDKELNILFSDLTSAPLSLIFNLCSTKLENNNIVHEENHTNFNYQPKRFISNHKDRPKRAKFKTYSCTQYAPHIKSIWFRSNQLINKTDWKNLLKLNDPLLITLKMVKCIDEGNSNLIESFEDSEIFCLLSQALHFVRQCHCDVFKSVIAREILDVNYINAMCNFLNNLMDNDNEIWKIGMYIIDNLSVVLSFYKDIIFYYNQLIPIESKSMLEEFLQKSKLFFTTICLVLGIDCIFENEIDILLKTLKHNNFVSMASCYPINALKPPNYLHYNIKPNFGFKSVTDYVESQFKLLKEDFESSLRAGITHYITNKKGQNLDVTIYNNVRIEIHDSNNCLYVIRFHETTQIDWTDSKFFTGSLILLTTNKFKNYFLAKVDDRGDKPGKYLNTITISFLFVPLEIDLQIPYVLAEAGALFDPYCHVMKVLRLKPMKPFPFEDHIIKTKTTIRRPVYLDHNSKYDLFGHEVTVSDINTWPSAQSVGLDAAQLDCLFNALNKELHVIQGPPGTGKTFLCKKIINVLLKNRQVWSNDATTPILVVTYKNLSLDEILTGLLKDNVRVLRIGNQSKSEELAEYYNLKNIKRHKDNWMFQWSFNYIQKNMVRVKKTFKRCLEMYYLLCEHKGLIPLELLKNIVNAAQFSIIQKDYINWILDIKNSPHIDVASLYEIDLSGIESMLNIYDGSSNKCSRLMEEKKLLLTVHSKLKHFLNSINNFKSKKFHSNVQNVDLYSLSYEKRMHLYTIWLEKSKDFVKDKLVKLTQEYYELKERYNETSNFYDSKKVSHSNIEVIGMTTSAAARLHKLLYDLKPRIVIVEEAAETLEGHCIAAINEFCQHLILCGDHKQLRPFTLSRDQGIRSCLSISLFERLINNGISVNCLKTQFRMHPDISKLISPLIYEDLKDSPSVCNFGDVKGMAKNVFFVNHSNFESEGSKGISFSNNYEVTFLLSLAEYLVKQDYCSSTITIIASYSEQEQCFHLEKKNYCNLDDIVISTLDGYQGKENEIVLLSLVRYNRERQIGFLKQENRICVALSRASKGFYMIGNCNVLMKCSQLWKEVINILQNDNAVGAAIPVKCQRHNKIYNIETAKKFKTGLCKKKCKVKLQCGHYCNFLCHGKDILHQNEFGCKLICQKLLSCGHKCTFPCHTEDFMHLRNFACIHHHSKGDSGQEYF